MTGANDIGQVSGVEVLVHPGKQELSDAIAARLVTASSTPRRSRDVAHVSLTGGSLGSDLWASVAAPARPVGGRLVAGRGLVGRRALPAGRRPRPQRRPERRGRAGLAPSRPGQGAPGPGTGRLGERGGERDGIRRERARLRRRRLRRHDPRRRARTGTSPRSSPGTRRSRRADAIAVAVHDSPKPPPDRVSLTFEALRRSREVWFVVAGADKAEAVAQRACAGAGPERQLRGAGAGRGAHALARRPTRQRLPPAQPSDAPRRSRAGLLDEAAVAQRAERLVEDGLAVLVGATLLHVGEVGLVRLDLGRRRRVVLVLTGREAAARAVPRLGDLEVGSCAKLGRVSWPLEHQNETCTRGAASPRSASPIGPAPTRLPRIALPPAIDDQPSLGSGSGLRRRSGRGHPGRRRR